MNTTSYNTLDLNGYIFGKGVLSAFIREMAVHVMLFWFHS